MAHSRLRERLVEILNGETTPQEQDWVTVESAVVSHEARSIRLAAKIFERFADGLRLPSDRENLTSQCLAAYRRLLRDPVKKDPGCDAKTAILSALRAGKFDDEDFYLKAAQYHQLEPVWNGAVDTAAELRVLAAFALMELPSTRSLSVIVDLLMDEENTARAGAARALGSHASDAALHVLRLKLHYGDSDPQTLGECCSSLLQIEKAAAIERIAKHLSHECVDHRMEVAVALGSSRLPEALPPLQEHVLRCDDRDEQQMTLTSIALISNRPAIEYLMALLEPGDVNMSIAVVKALGHIRDRVSIRQRLEDVVAGLGESLVQREFNDAFGGTSG